jgi:hypothetical protein
MTMRPRLVGAAALVAAAALPALAESSKAALQVSVTVTRSCRVETGGPLVVGCGNHSQVVQVSHDGRTSQHTLSGATPVAPSTSSTVTVEF